MKISAKFLILIAGTVALFIAFIFYRLNESQQPVPYAAPKTMSSRRASLPDKTLREDSFDAMNSLKLREVIDRKIAQPYIQKKSGISTGAGMGSVRSPEGKLILMGDATNPIVGGEISPDYRKVLVHHGSGKYSVYSMDGGKLTDLPSIKESGLAAIRWQWSTPSRVVGIAERNAPWVPNQTPDGDILPEQTLLFTYEIGDDTSFSKLEAPAPPAGKVIQLDGVTTDGEIILSIVDPRNYPGEQSEVVPAGIFRIP